MNCGLITFCLFNKIHYHSVYAQGNCSEGDTYDSFASFLFALE